MKMSKWSDKQVIVFSVAILAGLYVWVNSNVIEELFVAIRPFINGFILAYLTSILSTKIENKLPFKGSRGLSILMVYGLFIGLFALLLLYIVPILIHNLQLFFKGLPTYLPPDYGGQLESFLESLNFFEMTPHITSQLLGISGFAATFTTRAFDLVLTLVISIYVLLTKDGIFKLGNRISQVMFHGDRRLKMIKKNLLRAHVMFQQFLLTQLLVSFLLGLTAGLVLFLLDVNYAALIGVIFGILNIIPLFGGVVGIALSGIILFLANSPVLALASFIFLLLLQQIDATILTPKLMGNTLELNPIVVILALVLGMTYLGVIGSLFAVPICATLQEFIRERTKV